MLCASLAINPGYNVSSENTKLRRGGTHISKLSEESGRTTTITALRAQDRRVGVDSLHHMQIQRGLEEPLGCIYDWCSPFSYILVGAGKNNLPNTRLPTCMTFENRTLPVSCFSIDATKLLGSACPKPTRPRRSSEYETSAPSWCTMNRWNGLCETVSMA